MAVEAVDLFCGLVKKGFEDLEFVINLPRLFVQMEDEVERLSNLRQDITMELNQRRMNPKRVVKAWLDKAGKAIESSESIRRDYELHRRCLSWCPNFFRLYRIGKRMRDWKATVAQLHSEKDSDFPQIGEFGYFNPPAQLPILIPEAGFEGNAIKFLQSEIGVYGMGGEDKTSLRQTINHSRKPANPIGNHLEMELVDLRLHTVEEQNILDGIGICTYTREELAKATDNFATKVGQGVSGFVYRANLPGNRVGAVKRATNLDPTLFKQELSVLLRLPRHPHLVDLIGLCLQPGERILVFEFISNGSLHDRLHTERGLTSPLSWPSRMNIAYQVAVALRYLHEEARPPIFHRDVKSANVLLVDDNCAKLADFGLSKLGPKDNQFTITAVRGSYGYMDIQYVKTRRYSAKSDVYSFGVLLLELITGLKALHEDTPLAEWTQKYRFREDIGILMTIVDRNLIEHIHTMELQNMIQIANLCLREITEERPSMREIVNMMQNRTQSEINNASIREITEERPSMREIVNMMQNRTQSEINNASIS